MFGEVEDVRNGTFESHKAEGELLYKNGNYRKAIDRFTTALEMRLEDKNCLVARSRCYLQLGDTDSALQDAELSLKEDKNFHKGVYQKAEALYYKGEFELALVFFHRGHKLRPELEQFCHGIQKAQEAIDNSVGSPEIVRLTTEGDLSYFENIDKPRITPKSLFKPSTQKVIPKWEKARTKQSEKTIKQLLGELYGDKVYLEKLLKETDVQSVAGQEIYELVYDGLEYLDTRKDFWQQQRPMYARKRDTAIHRDTATSAKQNSCPDHILKQLDLIEQEQSEKAYSKSLRRAKRCLKTVREASVSALKNKMEIMANLYSYIGTAFLEKRKYGQALENYEKDLHLAEKLNLTTAKSRALDNLGRTYARIGDYQKAINMYTQRLEGNTSTAEKAWLYHELGRCHLELGDVREAHKCGMKSVAMATEARDDDWLLNATVLVAQAELKSEKYVAALQSFEQALAIAKLQGDESAKKAIEAAIANANIIVLKK